MEAHGRQKQRVRRFRFVLGCHFILVLAPQALPQLPEVPNVLTTRVGPARGTIIADGGFATPEIYAKFLEAAGGPDALIIDVPTANLGEFPVGSDTRQTLGLKAAGAKNIIVLHTTDRQIADSDSFVEPIKRAAGVWFEGGQPSRLVDTYAGTKTEQEVRAVLSRGGVVGGLSAGAVILASHLPQDGTVPAGYERGFGFLRSVVIEPHVVAREWLQSFAEWLKKSEPDLLGMAVDEGAAWVVRGDTAEVIGRGKAFIYGGNDSNDAGKPFLTLRAGDQYNLATRRVSRRAIDSSTLTEDFVDSLFEAAKLGSTGAAVLVAQDGKVLVNKSYNVPEQPKYLPTTTVPSFTLGALSDAYNAIAVQFLADHGRLSLDDTMDGATTIRQYLLHPANLQNGSDTLARLVARNAEFPFPDFIIQQSGSPYGAFISSRVLGPVGASNTLVVGGSPAEFRGNVDGLFRLESALEKPAVYPASMAPGMNISAAVTFGAEGMARAAAAAPPDVTLGWRKDTYRGFTRLSMFGTNDGRRNAFVRIPDKRISVIILSDKDDLAAQAIAERVIDRLVPDPTRR